MSGEVTAELKRKYQELDSLIQEIAVMEGVPDNGVVTQWAVVTGVVAFSTEDDYVQNDVQCLTPNAGLTTPIWQVKGLLDSALTKYRALEQHQLLDCGHDDEDGDH